ncbi:etoposide-induced protein 2.4-domain-containing protein [Radiomyces spectabilis]|uniref:etoposide-induced protein 2.4-domain-containing protein n=1 Tax=Radiomyces spectabilis TaxID=64574 RepID=UPI002220060D|nr:etoposide-induced protein 2.4-domain-containing protein [Radiomyces spectabilis]KAI8367665.1 etoposide-induced protein 2.4-domain-containing protein [Radiomyces spectabilis]
MYIALLGLNSTFYGQIAEKAYQTQTSRSNNRQGSSGIANTVQSMASTVYTIIFYINCGVFASLLRSIPTVGTLLSFLANCFIMSYYCFEYKWVYYGWTMEQRLLFVEQNWAYFLGFGLPGTVLTYFLSPLRSGAVFSLIYPSYVIMAMIAVPKSSSPYNHSVASGAAARFEWMLPNKLPLFYVVRKMNDLVILIVRLIGGVHADPIVSEKKKASMRKQE